MQNIISYLHCCNQKDIISNDEITNTSIISPINSNNKNNLNIETNKLTKNYNPFNLITSLSLKDKISPRFIDNGILNNENDIISSKVSKKGTYKKINSLISFSNFPIQNIQINKLDDNKIIGPKLLCSGELFFNKEIIINTEGMINGLRQKNDGQCFFGTKKVLDYKGISYNDFIINFQFSGEIKKKNDSSTGRVFNIYFQKKSKDYYLHIIHDSIIIYYEINNPVYFENDKDYYLLIGNVFIIIITKKVGTKKGIDIEIENEDGNNEIFSFMENEVPISIGRTNCKIIIPRESISKYHAEIGYSNELQKFYYKDCKSTNGSTLLVKEDDNLLIKGEMNLKLENIPFTILILP
jgi:hypothetical protein